MRRRWLLAPFCGPQKNWKGFSGLAMKGGCCSFSILSLSCPLLIPSCKRRKKEENGPALFSFISSWRVFSCPVHQNRSLLCSLEDTKSDTSGIGSYFCSDDHEDKIFSRRMLFPSFCSNPALLILICEHRLLSHSCSTGFDDQKEREDIPHWLLPEARVHVKRILSSFPGFRETIPLSDPWTFMFFSPERKRRTIKTLNTLILSGRQSAWFREEDGSRRQKGQKLHQKQQQPVALLCPRVKNISIPRSAAADVEIRWRGQETTGCTEWAFRTRNHIQEDIKKRRGDHDKKNAKRATVVSPEI